ncbi:MAG TPA: HEAT repeat domain-containing protein [Polyangiaceae bacterium]|nr:HEAT repeat domain-containing protein [Polyangiaceae bacterium]
MNPHTSPEPHPHAAPRPAPLPVLQAAKWPPDDDALPSGPPGGAGGGGGYGGGDDGDFKKGATKPAMIAIGALLVAGLGAALFFGFRSDAQKPTAKEIAEDKKAIALLTKEEQLPKWRLWAARQDGAKMQEEAFAQLAWAKDAEGLPLIIKGLSSGDHRVRGTAATALLEYGSPAADSAKPALLTALKEADASDKPQIVWALAALKETSAFDEVLGEYRQGHLAKVQRLDQNPAFDPDVLAGMVSLDKLAQLTKDPSESVRQLVATVLSRTGDAKWLPQLTELVTDKSVDVAREAAVGLGKIANESSMTPLLAALKNADKDSRPRFLEALRDGVGAKGLVLALQSVQKDVTTVKGQADREKFQTKQLFDMMRELEDPRAGDPLMAYLKTEPKPHWKTEAALRMAEIGDLRAVPTLAWRLRQDPLKLYDKDKDPEYRLDDNERVVSARMLADLAVLYPDKHEEIRKEAYEAVMFWITDKPQPHANGLRFVAAVDAREAIPQMKKWADPSTPFPKEGQQQMPESWATAQSALRYAGWMKADWGLLERQFGRRPKDTDVTMEGLQQGGLAVLGMTLRALGVGASHGMAQWGDSKAYPILVKYIEDKQNNEQARLEACFSLGWVSTDEQMKEVVGKVKSFSQTDPKSQMIRACYLETLIRRPVPQATAGLMDLMRADVDLEVRHQAARAIGFGGLTPAMAKELFDKLKDPNTRSDATLALLLGGDVDTVKRALATYNDADPAAMEELKVTYNQTFGYWSDRNYENGDVARWIENANACARVRVRDALQDWPRLILSRALQGIEYDSGPHSMTRVQLRVRLLKDARGADEKKRTQAIEILKFMKEKGVLMALKGESGPHAPLAAKAFFEVMNPKIVSESLPDARTPHGAHVVPPK